MIDQASKCEVCDKPISQSGNFKGVFGRMCQNCYSARVDSLFCPIDEIGDGVFLGNEQGATTQEILTKHEIKAICVCGKLLQTPFEGSSISYKKHEIADHPNQKIVHLFEENTKWIEQMRKSGKKVLIHCAAGVSRSASFTIAYFMRTRKMNYKQAFLHVKKGRLCIQPNEGFVQQLLEYEKELSLKNSES